MNKDSDRSHLWKKIKKHKADLIVATIPREYFRSKDKPTRFFKDNEYVTGGYLAYLPRICTAVYDALLFHCNTETQSAFPGIETLLELTGEKNPNTVSTAVHILEHYGIIAVLRQAGRFGRSNLYVFQDVRYWKAVDKTKGRIKIKDWQTGRYQKNTGQDINSEVLASENDKLTNLNKNYPNELTHLMKSLSDRMNVNSKTHTRKSLAIPEGSAHSVIRTAYEGEIPVWRRNDSSVASAAQDQQDDIKIDNIQPDNAGELQKTEDINIDITETEITAIKREEDTINLDIIESQENGGKMVEDEKTIYLNDIRNEDIGPGSATL